MFVDLVTSGLVLRGRDHMILNVHNFVKSQPRRLQAVVDGHSKHCTHIRLPLDTR